MLTKCIECGQSISDKALSCPHCGYPTRYARQAAIIEKTTSKIIDKARGCVPLIKSAGRHAKHMAILLMVIVMLAPLYWFFVQIALASIETRILINLFLPFFWFPILSLIRRFFGTRAHKIFLRIFIVMSGIGILYEWSILDDARVFSSISFQQILPALGAKCIGVFAVAINQLDASKPNVVPPILPSPEAHNGPILNPQSEPSDQQAEIGKYIDRYTQEEFDMMQSVPWNMLPNDLKTKMLKLGDDPMTNNRNPDKPI
jgi:ribosomal protein L37E